MIYRGTVEPGGGEYLPRVWADGTSHLQRSTRCVRIAGVLLTCRARAGQGAELAGRAGGPWGGDPCVG